MEGCGSFLKERTTFISFHLDEAVKNGTNGLSREHLQRSNAGSCCRGLRPVNKLDRDLDVVLGFFRSGRLGAT